MSGSPTSASPTESSPISSLSQRMKLLATNDNLLTRVQFLDALLEIGKTVTSLLDVDTILRRVVNEAVQLTQSDEGYLLLVDQDTGDLYLRAERNLGEVQARDFRIKISDSIAGQVVQSKEPLLIINQSDPIKVKTGYTVQALVNVPLIFSDNVLGVLGVDNKQSTNAFAQEDVQVLQGLADWAAIAITNARLLRQSRHGSKSTELINEISRSILSSLQTTEIPHKLIQHTTDIIGAECGSLALVNHETEELVFELAYNGQGQEIKQMRNLKLPLGRGIIGLVAADGQPRIVNDVRKNRLWYSEIDKLTQFTTENVLAVPLKTEGKIIGVIELLNKHEGQFDEDDSDLLMAVASAAAIAIQNARRYEALEQAHQELRKAQQQRIASEQWSILGRATANLAHRIHNTTTIVPLAVQDLTTLLQNANIPDEIREDVEANLRRIERNVTYTINLADSLLRRFHQEPTAAHDVNKAVHEAIAQVEVPDQIELVSNLAPNLPPVDSSSLLTDAIVELITNAIKAMPEGGKLKIITSISNDLIKITISDTGIGIPSQDQDKVFKLFHSNSLTGLGFGLWWVKTFLQQYGGEIKIDSQPGEGTTFLISLPTSNSLPYLLTQTREHLEEQTEAPARD